MTTLKMPLCVDISHWKEVKDFTAISPRPYLMITKATEGTTITDSKFVRFMDGMKQIGCHRGVYHFHRKAQSAIAQAQFFTAFIKPYLDDNTLLILDMEEGGELASTTIGWFDYVRAQFPRNRLLLYSAKYILEQMVMTEAQKNYFRSVPVWTAGYPLDPDQYTSVPDFYIPDQTRFGPVVMWQYSSHGAVAGIEGDVDLNWISPTYRALLGETADPEIIDPGTGEGMATYKGTVLATVTLQIREGPGTSYVDIGDLHYGDQLEASEIIGGWWKLTKVNNQPVTGYSYSNNGAWIKTDAVVVDPAVTLKHTIEIYSDGSLKIDGNPYP